MRVITGSAPAAEERVEVSWLDADGVEQRAGLGEAASVPFEAVPPVRRFPSCCGQRNFPGLYWSATVGGHVGFESWLEREHALLLDFDPRVVGYASHPLWLFWPETTASGQRRWRSHAQPTVATPNRKTHEYPRHRPAASHWAAHAARRRKTENALERVRQSIIRLQREKAQISVVAVARRADVSRTFLYGNTEAQEMITAAITTARARQKQLLTEQDDAREATWRERALNAEDTLKAAHTEILTQRTHISGLLGQIRDLEAEWTQEAVSASPPRTPP